MAEKRAKREVWMGLDERGGNGIGRRERSEEEKETCKVTVPQTQKREWKMDRQLGNACGWRRGRRRQLVWGSNRSQRSFDRRWKKEAMRRETAQMNRRRWWMQTRAAGEEIKASGEGEGRGAGILKYLWCHLGCCMTPPLCNNMNESRDRTPHIWRARVCHGLFVGLMVFPDFDEFNFWPWSTLRLGRLVFTDVFTDVWTCRWFDLTML